MEDPLPYDHKFPAIPNDLPLFPELDDVTGDDFPLNFDFDFSVDDLAFADNLLLDLPNPNPNLEINHSSDNVVTSFNYEPISSQDSNSNGNSSSPLLINDNYNDFSGVHVDLSRKTSNQDGRITSSSDNISNSPEFAISNGNCGVFSGNSSWPLLINGNICNSPDFGVSKGDLGVNLGNSCDREVYLSPMLINDENNSGLNSDLSRKNSTSGSVSKCVSKSKRKKGLEQDHVAESRKNKFRRSNVNDNVISSDENVEERGGGDEDEEKKKARLIRNRESAHLSRQRRKQYVEELEDKVKSMMSTITELNGKISYFMTENASLRQQLCGGVMGYPPPPMAGMAYPWMSYPPAYMIKPEGSRVPLVPIPRWKPQQPVSAPKVKKSSDGKKEKGMGKMKKVASVSLLGLLFFMLLFGGLVPMVNVRYGKVGDGFGAVQKGSVFMVDRHVGRFGHGNNSIGNSSEPLVASLYVPRNDKLVKIDGNLIIHSVLVSEKARTFNMAEGLKSNEETGLAIHGSYPPYPTPGPGSNDWRYPHLDRNDNGRQMALGSGSSDFTPVGSGGMRQQWFREGLAGPMLSSGMCTEVFQFDVSPTPGSIAPATSITNMTSVNHLNYTRPNKTKNRRILRGHAIPLYDHTLNTTKERVQSHGQSDGLQSNKTRSSVVVSVLVDPREVGDGGTEGVIGSKSLSRIFVVVLIDSVKYVTYSCMLPFMGSSNSHLITT